MPPLIKHIIVLMMENRSFDHMLGFLDHQNSAFIKLSGHESCSGICVSNDARYEIASPDHSHSGVMKQLLGENLNKPYQVMNTGFVQSYDERYPGNGHEIMRCFAPQMVPVLSTLAQEFAVCCRWFASVPGETWPNREFAHSATSRGRANINRYRYHSTRKTIFEQLDESQEERSWRIYHDDIPHSWCYTNLWNTPQKRARFQPMRKLRHAIMNDKLPNYAFVEPDFGIVGSGNSQHPGQADSRAEFLAGERLIARIYNWLREKYDVFKKTIFVITYDEHGGFYDREAPPRTVNPDPGQRHGSFDFDLLGPRVPAVIVSPWIPHRTVDNTIYDHSSIVKTVRDVFAPSLPALTRRDEQANSFHGLLTLPTARTLPELPTVNALSDEQGIAMESQYGALLAPVQPHRTILSAFHNQLEVLSASVDTALRQESVSGDGSLNVDLFSPDIADPIHEDSDIRRRRAASVLERFRAMAEVPSE